jgi:putative MATE family efflux protein
MMLIFALRMKKSFLALKRRIMGKNATDSNPLNLEIRNSKFEIRIKFEIRSTKRSMLRISGFEFVRLTCLPPMPAPALTAPPNLSAAQESNSALLRQLFALAGPVWIEQVLHMLVGLNDVYLANHLPDHAPDAGAAVGTITYFLWFIGLLVASIGTGSTALISRAKGARHKSLSNNVTGQSVSAAVILGIVLGLILYCFDTPIVEATQLQGMGRVFAGEYLRMLSVSLPFATVMFVAGACRRGGGDTVSPAIVMVIVDVVNMICSFSLTRGWWGLPVMGFTGIAAGTIIAYIVGGVLDFMVVWFGTSGARLYLHRLRPHWHTIKRLFRIGIPAGIEGLLTWFANFGVLAIINRMDPTNASSSAHINAVRLESVSYLSGIAFATAAATMVGISLGRGDPNRATRSAFLAFAAGGGVMTLCGILMITLGRYPAGWLAPNDPQIIHLTTQCLRITGFIQISFAANMILGGALRGAGDTFVVMVLNLLTIIGLRFTGVVIVGLWLHRGLPAVWIVLASELFIRGLLVFLRFPQGGWRRIAV